MDLLQQDQSSAPLRRVQPARRKWPWPLDLYQSAVGKKWAMAVTGIMLLGFVLVHMLGNLKVYLGPEDINHYGEWLRELLVPALPRTVTLWLLRLVLIGAVIFHLHAAYTLTLINRRARPQRYQSPRDYIAANFASRTMRWTGIIVILFVVFHLADLTWGSANPDFERGDVYHNMVYSFSRDPVAAIYIVANLALAVHIYHGAWSLFASLGVSNPRIVRFRRRFAVAFAGIILVGNVSFPIMTLAGVIEWDPDVPTIHEIEEAE